MQESKLSSLQHATSAERTSLKFVEDYLDSIYPYPFTAPPASCPFDPASCSPDPASVSSITHCSSGSSMSSAASTGRRALSYSAGVAYLHALMLRGIHVDGSELPSDIEVLLPQIHEDTSETHIPPSIFSTIWVRDISPNEATFGLTLPFLVMEWIYTIPIVKLAVNAPWNTLPLPASDQLILALPKPDLTLGIRMGAFGNVKKLASIPNYALPLRCDPTFAFPIITMESKTHDITDSRAQNLHNASIMLRNLSVVANMETMKVFTVSIGMTEIETRVHWVTNPAQPEFHFATVGTVYLTNQPISWLNARKSLESMVRFAYNSYVPILNSAIAEYQV